MQTQGTFRALRHLSRLHHGKPHHLLRRHKATGHPAHPPSGTGGLELTFLGTSSQGGARRYPSSLAMRLHSTNSSEVWLFDAGEGSLSQLQRSSMRVSLVRNIFITHLHGDHLYGLPSLVLSVLRSRIPDDGLKKEADVLDVYGPQGLRGFLRMALGVAGFRMPYRDVLRIHELHWPTEFGPKTRKNRVRGGCTYWKTKVKRLPYEASGRDLRPVHEDGKFTYHLLGGEGEDGPRSERPANVVAAPVLHTVPTFAYRVAERVVKRRFDKELLGELGVATDGSATETFQKWLNGQVVELDGRSLGIDDVMRDGREPRRVCVVGDTYDADGCAHIAEGVDVLIHEATNAAAQSQMARVRGHSSTSGATAFAKRVRAKRLILNHTSVSYSERKIRALEMEARNMFDAQRTFVARDLSEFSVPTCEEDDKSYVFRRFAGYANEVEARIGGDGPFGGDFVVGVDECEAGGGAEWGDGGHEKEGGEDEIEAEEEEEEDASWDDVEDSGDDSMESAHETTPSQGPFTTVNERSAVHCRALSR